MPLSGGLATAAGVTAGVVGGIAIVIGSAHARVNACAGEVQEVCERHGQVCPDSLRSFHHQTISDAQGDRRSAWHSFHYDKWPSKVHAERLSSLSSRIDGELAHARSCARWSCGLGKHVGAGGLCRDARSAIQLLTSKGPLVHSLAAFAGAHQASLAGQDVRQRFVLPSTISASLDSNAVMQLARERSRSGTPLCDLQKELESIVCDGDAVLAAQTATARRATTPARDAKACDEAFQTGLGRHAAALRVLSAQPELVAERQAAEVRAIAARRAVAAEATAREAASTRRAEEERRDAERKRTDAAASCRDAIRDLAAALRAHGSTSAGARDEVRVRGRGLPRPQRISDCRNWDSELEPITLEPIQSYSPADLVVLPCGKCMLSESVDQLRRPVDPFTNQPLPPVTGGSAGLSTDIRGDVERLIRKAEQACRS
jgi:hypothetical protein